MLSKGQPLEQWCLLLQGSALLTRYSAQHGSEQVTTNLGPNDSWSEAALLHSTHPRRSSVTVIAGPQVGRRPARQPPRFCGSQEGRKRGTQQGRRRVAHTGARRAHERVT